MKPHAEEDQKTGSAENGLNPARGFSQNQLRKLVRRVDPKYVHQRDIDGRQLTYIEGWYAIAQANEIFGYAGWSRETILLERTTQGANIATIGYMAKVRVRARAGSLEILREGTGFCGVSLPTSAAAHERAIKGAETDATKRALATFGPRFGLCLYDKNYSSKTRAVFALFDPDGALLKSELGPESYCTGLRQLLDLCKSPSQLDGLRRSNSQQLVELRDKIPDLRNAQGSHFADLLVRLMERRRVSLEELQERASASAERPLPSGPPASTNEMGAAVFGRPSPHISLAVSRRLRPVFSGTGRHLLAARRQWEPPAGSSAAESAGLSANAEIPGDRDVCECHAEVARSIEEVSVGSQDGVSNKYDDAKEAPSVSSKRTGELPEAKLNPENASDESEMLPPSRITNGTRIDKSKLRLPLERRLRDKRHLKRVGELPCLVCSRQPSHAHHLRFAQQRGISQKVSDEFVVPLCAIHHGDLHRAAVEEKWWRDQNLDPLPIAAQLWVRRASKESEIVGDETNAKAVAQGYP